jgi:SAM-dependent methyltransferase
MATTPQPRFPSPQQQTVTPARIFNTLNAYKQTQALKAAIELDLFTAIGEGYDTAEKLGLRLQASARGCRMLCDYLTVDHYLTKQADRYSLTSESATFLDRNSPACLGSAAHFLVHPNLISDFADLTECVKKGGTVSARHFESDDPIWTAFARNMAPLIRMPAMALADVVLAQHPQPRRVLDIAAGHGLFGITLAERVPKLEVTAVDWPSVLQVAGENASRDGVADRYKTLPGSAFETEFGDGYDVALVTGFLHHFDVNANEKLLEKVRKALVPGGLIAVLEFVPNEDRVSPPEPAQFALTMLAETTGGDAYTFPELKEMMQNAGVKQVALHELPIPMFRVVTGRSA